MVQKTVSQSIEIILLLPPRIYGHYHTQHANDVVDEVKRETRKTLNRKKRVIYCLAFHSYK